MAENIVNFLQKFYSDFQKFTYKNQIIVSATGYAIGMATKEVIDNFLKVILGPLSKNIFAAGVPTALKLIWYIGIWIITIVFTFIILEYFLNRSVIGLKSSLDEEKKKDFLQSKIEAKTESIIPLSKDDLKVVEKEKQEEKIIEHKTKKNGLDKINEIIDDTVDKKKEENKRIIETYADNKLGFDYVFLQKKIDTDEYSQKYTMN